MSDKSLRETLEDAFEAHSLDERYERAFGQLMIAWADAEHEMHQVLVAYTGVTHAVGRALFSGSRMRAMMDFIRSIHHNSPLPKDRMDDLEHVFPQIQTINNMRDHLAHHSTSSYSFSKPTHRVVANVRTSRYGKESAYEVSADDIEAMTFDLWGIANHLNMHHGPRTGPFTPWRESPESDAPTPWLYRQPPPVRT